MTKNYLRFLVEKIVVDGPRVQIITRSEAVVRMMAASDTQLLGPPARATPQFLPLSLLVGSSSRTRTGYPAMLS